MIKNPNGVRGEGDAAADVIERRAVWSYSCSDTITYLDSLPSGSVQLTIGSPPYADKGGRYEPGTGKPVKSLTVPEWVEWMLEVTLAARRVTIGDVIWVVNGPLKDGCYGPAVEGLMWRWYTEKRGEPAGRLERPAIWTKNAPPNRPDWFGNDWEFCVCFPAAGKREKWHPERIGTAPKFDNGGRFSQRGADGKRKAGGEYPTNEITRPRDVLRATVGGGHMGHDRAHDNEAPYPMKLIEPFVLALTDPGDVVCDPFAGSGTTCQTAVENGRAFIGCDIRESQVRLTRERMGTVLGW